jgi:hypothetical protein
MTLIVNPLPTMRMGQYASVEATITGPSPVHYVAIDMLGDGEPAWYFTMFDARFTAPYVLGPMKKRGRFEMTVRAVDEMGCEISNGVRMWAVIQ